MNALSFTDQQLALLRELAARSRHRNVRRS
jgi:hypothetical protein